MNSFWRQIGAMYLDHVAVITTDFRRTIADYLALPGSRLLRGPGINKTQGGQYAFVQLDGNTVIEILIPHGENSLIAGLATNRRGAYHLCFAVQSLDQAVETAAKDGAKTIVAPVADNAFDGRRIAFLAHPRHGLFELVEAFPWGDSASVPPEARTEEKRSTATISRSSDNLRQRLIRVMQKSFPTLADGDIENAALNQTDEWDSLGHIQLMMEIEAVFGISPGTDEIMAVGNFHDLLSMLEKHTKNRNEQRKGNL